MQAKTERFEMRLDQGVLEQVDVWRSSQGDLPSRAEAVRRLLDNSLTPRRSSVRLTDGEKLMTLMLCDIYKSAKVSGGLNIDLISAAIYGGHFWALRREMSGIFHGHEDEPRDASEVTDILDMWTFLEEAAESFSIKEMGLIKIQQKRFSGLKFLGFDGNYETEHMSIALFMTREMKLFSRFKDRDLNSHVPLLDAYRRMLGAFEPIRVNLIGRKLTVDEVIQILKVA